MALPSGEHNLILNIHYLWFLCLSDCYDPLDPNGNISITIDIYQWTPDGYQVNISFITSLFFAFYLVHEAIHHLVMEWLLIRMSSMSIEISAVSDCLTWITIWKYIFCHCQPAKMEPCNFSSHFWTFIESTGQGNYTELLPVSPCREARLGSWMEMDQ